MVKIVWSSGYRMSRFWRVFRLRFYTPWNQHKCQEAIPKGKHSRFRDLEILIADAQMLDPKVSTFWDPQTANSSRTRWCEVLACKPDHQFPCESAQNHAFKKAKLVGSYGPIYHSSISLFVYYYHLFCIYYSSSAHLYFIHDSVSIHLSFINHASASHLSYIYHSFTSNFHLLFIYYSSSINLLLITFALILNLLSIDYASSVPAWFICSSSITHLL